MTNINPLLGDWIDVPAGRGVMGITREQANALSAAPLLGTPTPKFVEDQMPAHSVEVKAFRVMKCPLTNEAYQAFVNAGGYGDVRVFREMIKEQGPGFKKIVADELVDATGKPGPSTWSDGRHPKGRERHPVHGICVYEAFACARHFGARLPTECEWEYMTRYPDGRMMPFASKFTGTEIGNIKELGLKDTTPVGAYPQGASELGILDLFGNVYEHTSSIYAAYPEGVVRESLTASPLDRVVRGGSYRESALSSTPTARFPVHPRQRFPGLGLRLVIDL